ncbi:MerR family transcriptional regulator [Scopulibacillus cellulosilyticus]|uniref:MerR family transcriptional regulator n=1 Tax=Scopulibacillus cellulosilyticus TaxID=2665665 RepID=A0ABW2PQF1_9BACL
MYKIGEVAKLANVSKRTVDYYTKMGLIEAKRFQSNHRYYTEDTINDLQLIMKYKQQHLSLREIIEKVKLKRSIEDDMVYRSVEELSEHMKTLDQDFIKLQTLLKQLDKNQLQFINKRISTDGNALLQSWTMLLKQLS